MARGGDICQEEAKSLKCPTFVLAGAKDQTRVATVSYCECRVTSKMGKYVCVCFRRR